LDGITYSPVLVGRLGNSASAQAGDMQGDVVVGAALGFLQRLT
jgi:hypothetical protein